MPAIDHYRDFDLLIERDGERYRSRVLGSPGGQATSWFDMPFSSLELENFLLRVGLSVGEIRRHVRRIDSSDMAEMKAFGGTLFRALFDERLGPMLMRSLDEARRADAGLRLRIRLSDAAELADVPWEYLYDMTANRFLNLSIETPVVRYLELPQPAAVLTVVPPLRVLVMISAPSDVRALDTQAEWTRIGSALDDLEALGLVTVDRLESASLASLQHALRRGAYHILHFVGHGGYDERSQDGVLLLEGIDGRSRAVSAQDLGTLLHDHRTLRLVILNSCEGARTSPTDPFAGAAQSLVHQGIPAVIAMQFEITDEAAIILSHEFYSALADGYPVDSALGEARKAIFAAGNEIEWGTPVLYMRAPDGRIFDVVPSPTTPERPGPLETVPPVRRVVTMTDAPDAPGADDHTDVGRPEAVAAAEAGAEEPGPLRRASTPVRGATPALSARLALVAAAILLVSAGLPDDILAAWFLLSPIAAVVGAGWLAGALLQGRAPDWAGGALLGHGASLLVTAGPLALIPYDGAQTGIGAVAVGAGVLALAGGVHRAGVPHSEPAVVGPLPAAGAALVAIAGFLPLTTDNGPVVLATMGEWVLGNRMVLVIPVVLQATWVFVLALYPSGRPAVRAGSALGTGIHLLLLLVSLGGYSSTQDWGLGFGLGVGLLGAAALVVGAVLRIRSESGSAG